MTELEQLKKDHALLGERIAKLEKPEVIFEVGKWYLADNNTIYNYQDGKSFGINAYGVWVEWSTSSIRWKDFRPATPKEIEEALIKEAERRGFKEGVSIKRSSALCKASALSDKICDETPRVCMYDPDQYDLDGDVLMANGCVIYCRGIWAEILKDEAIKIGGYEVKFVEGTNSSHIDGHTFYKEFWEAALTVSKHSKAKIKIGCSHQFDLTTETIEKILSKF